MTAVAEQIVINAGVAGSKFANSPVKKYGKLVTSVFVQLAKSAVINKLFTLILAGFLPSTTLYFTRLFVDFSTWIYIYWA